MEPHTSPVDDFACRIESARASLERNIDMASLELAHRVDATRWVLAQKIDERSCELGRRVEYTRYELERKLDVLARQSARAQAAMRNYLFILAIAVCAGVGGLGAGVYRLLNP